MLRRLLFGLIISLFLSGALVAQAGQFMEAPQYLVGPSPLAAATGDFNGDGKTDVVVTNKANGTVSVLLNAGNGSFQSHVPSAVGGIPAGVAAGDFNGDGKLDVAVTLTAVNNVPGSQVAVLLGKGDGTFQSYVQYNAGSVPQFVAAQDLNGDGKPDLVVANGGTTANPAQNVSVLLNNGTGGFPTHTEYITGVAPLAVAIADFDGDGKPDLAVANSCGNDPLCAVSGHGTVSVLLGNGNGTFKNQTTFQVGYKPDAIVAADLDGDRNIDLAVGNFNGNNVSVLIGQGNGTFKTQVQYPTAKWQPYGIVAADFNNDGHMDLAVSASGSTAVSILLGTGNGTFQKHQDYWAGNGAGVLAAADFNGDSHVDLAIPDLGWADRPDDKTTILMGNGDGTFQSHVLYETSVTPGALASADFNEDGTMDLVVGWDPTATDTSNARIDVLLSNANGTYGPHTAFPTGNLPASVAVGDFNKDGHMDIAAANYGTAAAPGNTVSVLLGNGDGTFQAQVAYNVGDNPMAITAADINHDGKTDLVFSNSGDSTPSIGVLLGNGDGSFQSQRTSSAGGKATAIAVTELNGDSSPDVVALLPNLKSVATLLGNGDGTFKAPVQFATGNQPVSLTVGDLNKDSKIDVAVVNGSDATLGVLLGNGDGTLRSQATYATPNDPTSVIAGDFNGDSRLDLLVSSHDENNASLFLGKGDGTVIMPPSAYGTGWEPIALVAADLSGDGALGVVAANSGADSISVILNAGGTSITLTSSSSTPNFGDAVTLTATVAPGISWNPATPSGTVSFRDGTTQLGTGTLSGGTATFTTSSLAAGNHSLSAAYSGDTVFLPHTSSSITVNVTNTSGFSMAASTMTGPITAGQSATSTITVTPAGNFSAAVTLTCSAGLPQGASCAFNPPSVTPTTTAATSVLTIKTTAGTSALHSSAVRHNTLPLYALWLPVSMVMMVGIGSGSFRSKKLNLVWLLLAVLVVGILLFLPACGGGSSTPPPTPVPGTPAGTYTITVTGTSGSGGSALIQTTTVTLTVQ